VLGAVAQQLLVDELAAVTGVDSPYRERELCTDVQECLEHLLLCFVAVRSVDRPAGI
jgi:hypothetical protein